MRASLLLCLFVVILSCDKQIENYTSEEISEYLPLAVGKYRTYRLDSTVYTNFGSTVEVHSYQEKHIVDAVFQEGTRDVFRIFRYSRSLNATTEPWKSSGSYTISLGTTAEVVEDNLRTIKLTRPLKVDHSWRGNAFLPLKPYSSTYPFNNDNEIGTWDYKYTITGETVTLNGKTFKNVITVKAIDESINVPVTSNQQFAYKNLLIEKYAKGVGLIYQEFIMFEYQPISASRPGYTGFGIKRSLIDFN